MKHLDERTVMTLDAGGTNFVFSAMSANREVVKPVSLTAEADNLNFCLENLVKGFTMIRSALKEDPIAISFAFPGPADYINGIIGDLPNLKAFRGGIALGPFLEEKFKIPVFINNDGDLFAYGEAIAGMLPEVNENLEKSGSVKRYKNLLGVVMGTGFGAGVVTDGKLHLGDNGSGGDIWVFRHKKLKNCITEESVGIAAIKRLYGEFSGERNSALSPRDIYNIAEGTMSGNRDAALQTFVEMGEEAGDTIAHAITLIDGLVVIGGGLAGASKYFMPALMKELNGTIGKLNGETFPRLQMKAYNLDHEDDMKQFLKGHSKMIKIPETDRMVNYDPEKRIGIAVSKLGASKAITLGAYAFALQQLNA